ncbi:uncharacterized protein BDW43DRAFT_281628 [Aspergillus alliaceus]|uniref:uncharacterized protein n=1 Tax=Petromyces alliaceus TaxID=209559 RepID=UPI0012A53DD6|nr:uncharacterized protein BDW43DRAFT_281628 [Aspergillus alliaceus]KAB8231787.1 hypothetical protein BDW43DRAFT_281628 [Aspergillus alliaceus]
MALASIAYRVDTCEIPRMVFFFLFSFFFFWFVWLLCSILILNLLLKEVGICIRQGRGTLISL